MELERADLLALVCGVFCEFVTFPLVSWVRCGTWLYRFLIFAPLLTCIKFKFCVPAKGIWQTAFHEDLDKIPYTAAFHRGLCFLQR